MSNALNELQQALRQTQPAGNATQPVCPAPPSSPAEPSSENIRPPQQRVVQRYIQPPQSNANIDRPIILTIFGMVAIAVLCIVFAVIAKQVGAAAALAVMITPPLFYTCAFGLWYYRRRQSGSTNLEPQPSTAQIAHNLQISQRIDSDHRNRLIRELKSLGRPTLMMRLHPLDFEEYVFQYYTVIGYSVERIPDGDARGYHAVLTCGDSRILIRCFSCPNLVPENNVRDFLGALSKDGAPSGMFVTASGFDIRARRFADGTPINLVDGPSLARLIDELYCIDPVDGQPVEMPLFRHDAWDEFEFAKRTRRRARHNIPLAEEVTDDISTLTLI